VEVILFSASWCAPCKQLKEFTNNNGMSFSKVYDIDTDEGSEAARKFGVRGVPITIAMKDGGESKRVIGFNINEINEIFKGI